jgi:hypothetical protein
MIVLYQLVFNFIIYPYASFTVFFSSSSTNSIIWDLYASSFRKCSIYAYTYSYPLLNDSFSDF